MAAPAGSGGSAVSVLAPNGRRHTVKVTPSTVLLQVLEDTCRRQDFNPNEYDLKFQRNVLDLSLQWRFANLPNNAKLEMVPISRSREGPENMVRIALQLDDGSRLQDTFCSGQTLWELLCHFAQIRECLDRPCEASPVCVYMRDEVTGRAALQSTTLQSLGLTGGSAIIRFSMKRHDSTGKQEPGVSWSKSPESPTPSLLADQAASSPLFPLNSAGLSQGDVSHQDEAARRGAGRVDGLGPKPVDAQAKQISKEPTPAPFVPFSGGGQRLGGPSGSVRPLMSSSAKLPKSFSSPAGPSQPKKLRPGQEPQPEPELPVDRDPVVCHPDLEVLLQAWPAELPDEFFEVTVDDVRRRLAQLKSERKRLEEAPLVTKAFRDAQMKEKLQRYPKVVLRVLFPDRYILQGFFRPSETVGDLRDFVRSHLGNPKLPFYLFIAPPKTILDDHTLTLFQLALEPWGLCSEWRPCPPAIRELAGLREGSLPPSCGQTSSLLPLCTLDLRSQQASTWSPRCWNTPFPRLQLTCWWPGPCPGLLEPHPRRQPLTLRPLSWSQLLRKGQWAPLSPALGQPSRQQEVRAASPEVPLCHHRTPAHPERE
ncbi:tether containing UBX domain for GLUT4 isoform X2 [Eubalaena glacialis]|uniref:tether containing UBX domain for GLUT4 isoform X2 n=1 Tax=Eubalaena glacialis TaxID=27606 RepID=UPI002A59A81D|nr:tether containing UBX domain for GLUT4 isoform X2 [Eubalaena glacialis]